MKMLKNTLVFTVVLGCLACAVSTADYSNPAHPGKCVIKPNFIVGPGEHDHPDMCARIHCRGGPADITSCPRKGNPPGCIYGAVLRPKGRYPDCCQREKICQ